jgi:AAA15 family ATPase/GTPase
MLIEFRFKNFFSYRSENKLSMSRVKSFKELEDTHVIKTNRDFDLLKTAAVYGSNGGGKTNFILAMSFMSYIVHNSFAESLKKEEDKDQPNYYFRLNEESEKEASMFEVSFLKNDIIYRYGFLIKGYEIISEWLYKKNEAETLLFERNGSDFKINQSSFIEGEKHKDEVNSNVLFISHLAQYNGKEASIIFDWFFNLNIVSGLDHKHYKNITEKLLGSSEKFNLWLTQAVRFLDITKIELAHNNDIVTYHNKYDKNNIITSSVQFDIDDESQGTKKIIYLLGAIYNALIDGKILFIDEFNSKLHPNLSKKLLDFFHIINRNKAQFIFTAHDAILLDKELLRRDQIWFVDRNRFNESILYPMSDFDASVVRSTSDFKKKYLSSTFGAAETMDIKQNLIELIYEE